ncbi:MAG: FMN-binding protein, partial [Gemmatimonadetes bacterium]|nr:FMN-binding protein [Gemmatimonadota bacterium]
RPLVAISSAAVFAVYSAGYVRTQSAAEALDLEMAARRAAGRREAPVAAPDSSPLQVLRDTVAALQDAPPAARVVAVDTSVAPRAATPKQVATTATDSVPTPTVAAAPVDSTPRQNVPAIPEYVAPPAPAAAPPVATDSATSTPVPKVVKPLRDGAFHGYGSSRHGDIEVRIEIVGQKVVYAEISRCMTRWPCSIVERLPAQVIERQTADVDIISGATASSDAFYMAVLDALSTSRGK